MNLLDVRVVGLLIGLLFGVVLVWQDAQAAWIVLLFGLTGLLIGIVAWLVSRIAAGDVDVNALRELMGAVTSGRTRR